MYSYGSVVTPKGGSVANVIFLLSRCILCNMKIDTPIKSYILCINAFKVGIHSLEWLIITSLVWVRRGICLIAIQNSSPPLSMVLVLCNRPSKIKGTSVCWERAPGLFFFLGSFLTLESFQFCLDLTTTRLMRRASTRHPANSPIATVLFHTSVRLPAA